MSEDEKDTALTVVPRGDTYPLELRLQARDLFLSGLPIRKVAEKIEVHRNTVFQWSNKGHWRELREELLREEERKQISRVRKDIAEELSRTRQRMAFLDRLFMTSVAYKQEMEKDDDGKDVPTGRLIPREPADLNLSLNKAIEGMMRLSDRRIEYVKVIASLLGNLPSKLDPAHLDINQLPDAVIPPPDGVGEPTVLDPGNVENPNDDGGEDDGNEEPN